MFFRHFVTNEEVHCIRCHPHPSEQKGLAGNNHVHNRIHISRLPNTQSPRVFSSTLKTVNNRRRRKKNKKETEKCSVLGDVVTEGSRVTKTDCWTSPLTVSPLDVTDHRPHSDCAGILD
ncbi:hypothetical protein JTE90_007118 [Oedothorax gibbosus]|uniref:Uncharacterized protein n=1 Tax=Oedothorax gibbosus TaxID=931172 RepID=A0AAV6VRN3_9ARAC|nr:hypothetical protein JTE90_007118 [Oedothorax gibbosus]